MATPRVHVGEYPVTIKYTIQDKAADGTITPHDLTVYSSVTLRIKNADDAITTITGALPGGGTDGEVEFVTLTGTWTAVGESTEQVHMLNSGTSLRMTVPVKRRIGQQL